MGQLRLKVGTLEPLLPVLFCSHKDGQPAKPAQNAKLYSNYKPDARKPGNLNTAWQSQGTYFLFLLV